MTNQNYDSEQIIDINSNNVTTSSIDADYPEQHYLKLILIYFLTMYFASSIFQIVVMSLYKVIFDMPTGSTDANGVIVYTKHFQDFVNLWTQIGVYGMIFAVLVLSLKKVIRADLFRTKGHMKDTFKKAGKGILYVYVASYVSNIILMILQVVDESENQTAIVDMLHSSQTFAVVLYCAILIIVAPIVEELIFRKAMFGYLRKFKFSKNIKILITGLLFGGIHVATAILVMLIEKASFNVIITEVLLGIPYCVMGCVLGYIYVESDENVVVPTLVHMFNNALSVILNLFLIYYI